jgi:hypothetical protein
MGKHIPGPKRRKKYVIIIFPETSYFRVKSFQRALEVLVILRLNSLYEDWGVPFVTLGDQHHTPAAVLLGNSSWYPF